MDRDSLERVVEKLCRHGLFSHVLLTVILMSQIINFFFNITEDSFYKRLVFFVFSVILLILNWLLYAYLKSQEKRKQEEMMNFFEEMIEKLGSENDDSEGVEE